MRRFLFIFVLTVIISSLKSNCQPRFYKAQMHCHTTNSDGTYSPVDLTNKYKNEGYEIMMITDHNFMTDASLINIPNVLCINSEEITFSRHMNGFFLNHVIAPSENFTCQDAIDSVRIQEGLIQLNHYCPGPFTDDSWEVTSDELLTFNNGPDILEIWNTGTEGIQTHDDKTIWDALLTAGKVVWGSADDDFHPSVMESLEFNKGYNMLFLDSLTKENVYQSLKNGNFYASTGTEISQYTINDYNSYKTIEIHSNATKIDFWGPGHNLIQEINGGDAYFILQNYSYIRAELTTEGFLGMGNKYAWTQPVFLNNTTSSEIDYLIPVAKVFPNPASTSITLSLFTSKLTYANINIIDLLGRKKLQILEGMLNANQNDINTDISSLNNGQYLIIIKTNSGIKKIPLQINR